MRPLFALCLLSACGIGEFSEGPLPGDVAVARCLRRPTECASPRSASSSEFQLLPLAVDDDGRVVAVEHHPMHGTGGFFRISAARPPAGTATGGRS